MKSGKRLCIMVSMEFELREYQLRNGVRVVEVPMVGVESVMAMVLVRTGSRNERDEELGISHVLEHMVFKGTEKYPTPRKLAEVVDAMGAEFNAFTGKEYTAYYIKSASENLKQALEVLGEMVVKPRLEAEALEREKGVIIEEINMYEDRPMERAGEEFENLLFAGSNLGRLIIGSRETVRGVTAESLKEYKKQWYRGENVVVMIGGNLNRGTREWVETSFEGLEEGKLAGFVDRVRFGSEREKIIEKGTEQTHFVVGVPGLSFDDERKYAEAVLRVILGGNMSSRLFTEIREKRGLAYYVGAMAGHFYDGGYLAVRAGVRKDKFEEALEVVKEQMRLMGEEVSQEELTKAKGYLRGKIALSLEGASGVVRWFGKGMVLKGDKEQPNEWLKQVEKVSLEEVISLGKELFKVDEMRVAVVK